MSVFYTECLSVNETEICGFAPRVQVSMCLYMHAVFVLCLHCVCERSGVFICAQAKASSAPLCLAPAPCPSVSESSLQGLVPNVSGNNGDVPPPDPIWWPADPNTFLTELI